MCIICKFARMSGGEAMKEKAKRKRNGRKTTLKKICPTCYSGKEEGMQHKCSSNDVEKAENLLNQLPESVAAKLASAYIKSHTPSTPTEPILLPQPSGHGKPLPVTLTTPPSKAAARHHEILPILTHEEVFQMRAETGVSGAQMEAILANLRIKFGHSAA